MTTINDPLSTLPADEAAVRALDRGVPRHAEVRRELGHAPGTVAHDEAERGVAPGRHARRAQHRERVPVA